jgi:ketosteroid isomerase-like protein
MSRSTVIDAPSLLGLKPNGVEHSLRPSRLPACWLKLQVRNMVVHATADPEVVIAEWDYDGVVTTTGRSFRVSNVQVSRVRNGKIVESRDYHNHAFLAVVTDRLSATGRGVY